MSQTEHQDATIGRSASEILESRQGWGNTCCLTGMTQAVIRLEVTNRAKQAQVYE